MRLTMERVRALLAVDGTRRLFGGVLMDAALVRDLAADLLDAHAALATERERAEAAEAALAALRTAALEYLRDVDGPYHPRPHLRADLDAALAGCP